MRLIAVTVTLLGFLGTTAMVPMSKSAPASVEIAVVFPNEVPAIQPAVIVGASTPQGDGSTNSMGAAGVLDADDMGAVLSEAGWPAEQLRAAKQIAGCESSWDPQAVGEAGEVGLFQIHPFHFRYAEGASREQLFSPVANAEMALELWRESGWAPWSCESILK